MTRRDENRILLASIAGTTASVFPAFLTGAVAVQLSADLGLSEIQLGVVIGAFFTSAALGSAILGRTAERLGPTTSMRIGLTLSAVTGLALSRANGPLMLGALLLLAGSSNALTQPAANLLLAGRIAPGRLGLAMALKQAGMPSASLLGGLAVPALALTLGWEAAYLAGAGLAVLALCTVTGREGPTDPDPASQQNSSRRRDAERPGRSSPDLSFAILALYGLVGLLGAATAGAVVTFLVTGAEQSGIAPGPAGLLLTFGSVLGIFSRVQHGRLADGPRLLPIRRVALLLGLGAAAALIMAFNTPLTYVLATIPMFAFGWAWPGLFNLSVVRNNPSAPATATGITQTGVYIGAGAGPVVGGMIVGAAGFPTMWLVAAIGMSLASATALLLRVLLRRTRETSGRAVQPNG